jgi:hypothetical protein
MFGQHPGYFKEVKKVILKLQGSRVVTENQ